MHLRGVYSEDLAMARIFLLVLSSVWVADAQAQEPAQSWFVAFDQESARLLPAQQVLGILVQDQAENYDTINAAPGLCGMPTISFIKLAGSQRWRPCIVSVYKHRGSFPSNCPAPCNDDRGRRERNYS